MSQSDTTAQKSMHLEATESFDDLPTSSRTPPIGVSPASTHDNHFLGNKVHDILQLTANILPTDTSGNSKRTGEKATHEQNPLGNKKDSLLNNDANQR